MLLVLPGLESEGRLDRKTSSFPSGLKRGLFAENAADVSLLAGVDPSARASQISLRRSFDSSMRKRRVNATRLPSGEIAGSAALSSR